MAERERELAEVTGRRSRRGSGRGSVRGSGRNSGRGSASATPLAMSTTQSPVMGSPYAPPPGTTGFAVPPVYTAHAGGYGSNIASPTPHRFNNPAFAQQFAGSRQPHGYGLGGAPFR